VARRDRRRVGRRPRHELLGAADPEGALDDRLPTLVSEPLRFGIEVRAFILERQVVTSSPYVRDGDIAKAEDGSWPLTSEERDGATKLLADLCVDPEVPLPPGVVVDVGRIEGRGWAVVEANAAWASGVTTVARTRLADGQQRLGTQPVAGHRVTTSSMISNGL